ncbi:MAG: rod shape-determining protein MreC, partial [Parvibaculales bacterium]
IISVGKHASRVLMITDLNSRIPVFIGEQRIPAILVGDNSKTPRVKFIPDNAEVKAGMRVITSGDGRVLPANIPIGTILSAKKNRFILRSFVDFDKLEYARILIPPHLLLPPKRETLPPLLQEGGQ